MMTNTLDAAVRDWLERERERYMAAATALGIPPEMETPVVVARDVSETGYATATETRVVNSYNVDEVAWAMIGTLDSADTARPLAKQLLAAYGTRVHVSNTLYPQLFQTDPEDWIAKVLLRPLAPLYVRTLRRLNQPDPAALQRITDEFVRALEAETITAVTLLPVAGLRVNSELRTGAVIFRPIAQDEFDELAAASLQQMPRGRLSMSGMQFAHVSERALLEVRETFSKDVPSRQFTLLKRVVLALQLLGYEPHGRGFSTTVYEPVPLMGMLGSPVVVPGNGAWRGFDARALEEAVALAATIPIELFEGSTKRAHIALARFQTAAAERFPADSVIDYAIALEATLLPPAKESELRYRFSIYGAYFLGRGPTERADLFGQFQAVYDARSSIVHGSALPPAELGTARDSARRLAAAVLVKALRDGWPTRETLTKSTFGP